MSARLPRCFPDLHGTHLAKTEAAIRRKFLIVLEGKALEMYGLRGWVPARVLLSLSLLLLAGCSLPGTTAPTATPAPAATPVATTVPVVIAPATTAAASAAPSAAAIATAVPTLTATARPTVAATVATPSVAASPATPPATPVAVATATPPVSAAPGGAQTIRDVRQACELTLPAGFSATSSPGSFASADGKVLVALQSLSAGPENVLDDLALPFVGSFIPTVTGYQQTAVIRVGDSLRIDFTGGLPQPGRGTLYFHQFGGAICVLTYFVVDGADVAFDALLDALVASLRPRGVG